MNTELLTTIAALARARQVPAMLVGGAVRDLLLGKPVHDYDFVVLGNAAATERLARNTANALNGAFYVMDVERGTCRVIVDSVELDFSAVRGASFEDDLCARDFTINAIGLPVDGIVEFPLQTMLGEAIQPFLFDPLHGAHDLKQSIVRMCSPSSISDDPIRAMRAVRMVTTLNAMFVTDTVVAARAAKIDYKQTSPERVRDEFFKLLALPNPRPAMRRLHALGLLTQIIPEAAPFVDEVALDSINVPTPPIDAGNFEQLAAQLSTLTAEGRTRREALNFALLHVPLANARIAEKRARFLKLTGDEVHLIGTVVGMTTGRVEAIPVVGDSLTRKDQVHKFLRDAGGCAPEVALGAWVIAQNHVEPAPTAAPELIDIYFSRYAPGVAPAPLITGADLIALGMEPGPHFGKLLEQARMAQMTGVISTSGQAIDLCRPKVHERSTL